MCKKIRIKSLIILLLVTILTSCSAYEVDITKQDDYIVNKRSLKIHSLDCSAIDLMSEHNKTEVHDSIQHLLGEGYIVCEKCKARKRQKIFGFINNQFEKKEYIIDIEELPSREEYLNAIDTIGEWYINHVPTYQGKLSEEKLYEYEGNDKNYKIYNLKSKNTIFKVFSKETTKDYIVISTDSNAEKIINLDTNTNISKAKEEAIINYKNNYEKIDIKPTQAYYPCEYIKNSRDNYKMAGDDCVRFFFTVMNSIDKDFTYRLCTISNQKWNYIQTKNFWSDKLVLLKALLMNGFELYSSEKFTLNEFDVKTIDSDFKLMKGDVLLRNGHLHIFLGNDYGKANNFGWGKVNRIFPQNYGYMLKKDEENNYYIACDKDIESKDGSYRKYTRVYRYKGGGLGEDK